MRGSISLIFLSVIYVGYFLLGKRWGSIFFIITICLFSFGWGLSSVLVGIEVLFNLSYGMVFCLILAGAVIMTLSCLASIRIYSRKYS